MLVKFKMDIHNRTYREKDLTIFGMEQSLNSPELILRNMTATPFAGAYNTSNGLIYRVMSDDTILITQGSKEVATLTGVNIASNQALYNPFNETVYLITVFNKVTTVNNMTLADLPMAASPFHAMYNDYDHALYLSNNELITQVYRIASNNALTTLPVPGAPASNLSNSRGAYNPANHRVYFPATATNEIYVYDTDHSLFEVNIPTGSIAFQGVYMPLNFNLYFSSVDNQLYAVDAEDIVIPMFLPAGHQATQGVYSEQDQLVYFISDSSQQFIYAIDKDRNITIISAPANPTGIIYQPADGNIYITTTTGFLILKNKEIIYQYAGGATSFPVADTDSGTVSLTTIGQRILFYENAPLVTSNLEQINSEVNTGAFKIKELKLITSDSDQFNEPLELTRKSLTERTSSEFIFPIDYFTDNNNQNVVILEEADLNCFIGSIHNSIRVKVKPQSTLCLIFTGELVKESDLLFNKRKIEFYE